MRILFIVRNIFPSIIKNIIKYIYMKWSIDYNICKISNFTDLKNKTIKIWKNVKINTFWIDKLQGWIEISDYVRINWLNGFYNNEQHRIIIGKFCSIAIWATFIAEMHHDYRQLTTYIYDKLSTCSKNNWGTITIWNDVRIWRYAIILKWCTVGTWAVIWAWSVVTKDVPPYAIVWWNPAKIIKYRFDNKTIKQLLKSEWRNREIKKIKENYNLNFIDKEFEQE